MELREELKLPPGVRAKTNPKSSTGRLDVFTRVITDRNDRFDDIAAGYHGKLYLEIVPRTFAIRVRSGMALNQLRLASGDARVSDHELRDIHAETPLLYLGKKPLPPDQLDTAGGLFLRLSLGQDPETLVGYRAKKHSLPIDLARVHTYDWREFWDPVYPERGGRIVLEPETSICFCQKKACGFRPGMPPR